MTKKKQEGFTLVELVLYIGIISIIFSAIVPLVINIIYNSSKSAVQQEVSENARFISERILYEIRRAKGISSVSANSISLTNFSPDSTTVIDLSGGNVRINDNGTGVTNLNSTNTTVSDLTFTQAGTNISFTMTVLMNGARQEYQSSISLRSSATERGDQ
jgi:type II secretory pathway pseudopilin PulG